MANLAHKYEMPIRGRENLYTAQSREPPLELNFYAREIKYLRDQENIDSSPHILKFQQVIFQSPDFLGYYPNIGAAYHSPEIMGQLANFGECGNLPNFGEII